jgi:ribosome-associated translation inhibitor RaiA
MDLFNQELMYEFHAKDLSQTEAIKQYSDSAVREIKAALGWDAEVQVTIEPEAKDKRLFSVAIGVYGAGDPIVVKKEGKHVLAVLRKVRKSVLRQIHRQSQKKVTHRRNRFLRLRFAS